MKTSFTTLKVDISDRRAVVTLQRPEVRNAFHPTMIVELTTAFTELSLRKDLAVVIFRGEGKGFCSGADLSYMQAMAGFSFDENVRDSSALFAMFESIKRCAQPVLARVHGSVMGGGVGLVAACDIAGAVDGSQFCFSEVKLGLVPAVISSFVLDRMAAADVRRYMLTGESFGIREAMAAGLVQFAGGDAEVDAFIESTAAAIEKNGPEAVRATKRLIAEVSAEIDWLKKKSLSAQVIAERRASGEGQEGLKSFLEKRSPRWRSKA